MLIKTKITFKEYVKLLYGLIYKKPIMKLLVAFAFLMLIWIIIAQFDILSIPKPTFYQYITLSLISVVQPIVIYSSIWTNYYSSNHLKEKLAIEFDHTTIQVTGDSFFTKLTWEKTYKVVEVEKWFLIYQNNFSAIIIPKKSFTNEQLEKFKQLLKSIPIIDLDLKEDS